jgi:hypothetical protein
MAGPGAEHIVKELWYKLNSPWNGAALRHLAVMALWRRVAIFHAGVTPRPAAVLEAVMPQNLTEEEITVLQWADPCHQERVSDAEGVLQRRRL